MNKKYIKPSIVVEATLLKTIMETVSVAGQINDSDRNGFTIMAGVCWTAKREPKSMASHKGIMAKSNV